ncbi:hypothetical protein BDK51DRAFT_40076 [Blyttiomyces helicus]|uniref:RNA polymerase II degradation factor 1 n=1 Tax=Blyttiomyces helicus TaxID=388810 RepID=A0A4P9WF26_9FUNG|nr:hypothetical protein BDK51DRAFT_40076 [Blyttiomyces helicus]|eukprot:RKO89026.1 hypothetical protein BDK51DRAFT_40076 [Blyttiomyces helicus]
MTIYTEELASLKLIFEDWTETDLVTVLEEVSGDLELAVGRISEGHVQQWGEVKTQKKEKKPKAPKVPEGPVVITDRVTGLPRPPRSHLSNFDPKPPRGGGLAGRGGRGGGRGGRGLGRGGFSNGGYPRPPRQHNIASETTEGEDTSAGSWGAAATADATDSTPEGWAAESSDSAAVPEGWGSSGTAVAPEGWGASGTSSSAVASEGWGATTEAAPAPAPASVPSHRTAPSSRSSARVSRATASTSAAGSEWASTTSATPIPVQANVAPATRSSPSGKTSWAQLVKGPEPAPTPAPPIRAEPVAASGRTSPSRPATSHEVTPIRAPSPARSAVRPPSPAKERSVTPTSPSKAKRPESPVPAAASTPAPSKVVAKPAARAPSPVKAPIESLAPAPAPAVAAVASAVSARALTPEPSEPGHAVSDSAASAAGSQKTVPPGLKQARPAAAPRKLKQNAPVVMPSNATLSTVGMQFGSLRLGTADDEPEAPTAVPSRATAEEAHSVPATHASHSPSTTQLLQQQAQQQGLQQTHAHQAYQTQQVPQQQPQVQGRSMIQPQLGTVAPSLPKQPEAAAAVSVTAASTVVPVAPSVPNAPPPYNTSYFPNQPLTAASGFNMSHMGSPADYSQMYPEAQRVAMQQAAYYDPSYQTAASKYQTPEASAVPASTQPGQSSPQQNQQQPGPHPSQYQPNPYHSAPYYPYPQYAYQQPHFGSGYPSYGQPLQQFNKSVYPNYGQQQQQPSQASVSQQQQGSTQKASALSNPSYGGYSGGGGGQGVTHQPHLYHQGYDDLSSGLGVGVGAQDYSKGASAGLYGMPHQQAGQGQGFQGFGMGGGAGAQGVQGGPGGKVGGQGDFKSQVSSVASITISQSPYGRETFSNFLASPSVQSYDSHKYQQGNTNASSNQGSVNTTANPASGVSAASTASPGVQGGPPSQSQSSFYNQHHLAGLHAQQHLAYPHLMHQSGGYAYGSGQQQQRGQYWSGQS